MLSRKCNSVTPNYLISHPPDRMDLILLSLLVSQSYFITQLELRFHPVILSLPEERMIKYSRDHTGCIQVRLRNNVQTIGSFTSGFATGGQPLVLCCHCKLQIQISPVWLDQIFNWMQGKKVLGKAHFLVSKPFCWISDSFSHLPGLLSMQHCHR